MWSIRRPSLATDLPARSASPSITGISTRPSPTTSKRWVRPAMSRGPAPEGWRIGRGWLTLLKGGSGGPRDAEIILEVESAAEAEALQRALIEAGGRGPTPS